MTGETLLTLCLLIPAFAGIILLGLYRMPRAGAVFALVAAALQIPVSFALLGAVDASGYVVVQPGNWPAPFGITLVADRFSAAMVAIAAVVGLAVTGFALANLERNLPLSIFLPLAFLLLLGVNGAFLTGDLFNMFVWFEVMLIASFVLMVVGGMKPQLDGGVKYVILNLFASALFLIGIGMLYGKLGTLNMADIANKLAAAEDPVLINTTSVLLLVAFGIKAGLFPLFFWLPASYHVPAFAVSGLFAALLTKVGVYALARAHLLLFAPYADAMRDFLLVIALATMVTGVLGAAAQFHVRRILSFHIISQIGYMLLGLAIATPLAVAGALFTIVHNIIAKTNLFFIAALIHRHTGHEDLAKLGGLAKRTPGLATLFLISALALAGIPPLSGFWAKFTLARASFEENLTASALIALGVGLLTLFSMTKIWNEAFWKKPPDETPGPRTPPGFLAHLPVIVFAGVAVAAGLAFTPFFEYFLRAAEQMLEPGGYVRAVLGTGLPLADHQPVMNQ